MSLEKDGYSSQRITDDPNQCLPSSTGAGGTT